MLGFFVWCRNNPSIWKRASSIYHHPPFRPCSSHYEPSIGWMYYILRFNTHSKERDPTHFALFLLYYNRWPSLGYPSGSWQPPRPTNQALNRWCDPELPDAQIDFIFGKFFKPLKICKGYTLEPKFLILRSFFRCKI